jgi:Tol biopolymer transport system component
VLYSPPSVGAEQELVWLDADGRERPAAPLAGEADGIALSTDAARAAVTLRREPSSTDTVPPEDVWVMNLKTSATTRLTTTGQNIRPTWSLDGARVLFVARDALLERQADASAPVRRVVSDSVLSGSRIAEGAWVNGGRLLLRNYPGKTRTRDIVLYDPAARDSPPRVIVGPPGDKTNPRISPDGKWLAYGSNETGRYELYVIPFPRGGARVAVSTEGANHPRWSADGRTLYYFTLDGALMMTSVNTSGDFSVGERREHPSRFRHTAGTDPFYDVGRDGRILVAKALAQTHRLVLVRNWFTELGKGAAR